MQKDWGQWGGLELAYSGVDLASADQIVVLLHGYGTTNQDLIPLGGIIGGDRRAFVYPNGPVEMSPGSLAWATTEAEFVDSKDRVLKLIRELAEKYPQARISLGGFSQGATLSAMALTEQNHLLEHLFLYSPALAITQTQIAQDSKTQVLLSHGRDDSVLPFADSQKLNQWLRSRSIQVNWIPFEDGHTIPEAVLEATRQQLDR
ncbi:alpha/beta hydrolase [Stieleria sp. JC731]|uniref:alpha/beta hydrolase n=1 Tax=Stieleria sp. JC731 TaxID=2894195 RepID=UPI001E384DDA|nr:dienelactone hydrolase family protein [Stieleria sp. JC731]